MRNLKIKRGILILSLLVIYIIGALGIHNMLPDIFGGAFTYWIIMMVATIAAGVSWGLMRE